MITIETEIFAQWDEGYPQGKTLVNIFYEIGLIKINCNEKNKYYFAI